MSEKNIPDFITYGRTFENYKWYKPIIVLILGTIIWILLNVLILLIFGVAYGSEAVWSSVMGGYESMNSELGSYISYMSIAIFIPSLYISSRIIRDRPFSSYSSSSGGWDWKLFFKCLAIPLVTYTIYMLIFTVANGFSGTNTMTLHFFLICLILIPLQCIGEEYVFRGFLMQTLGSWFKIPILAVIIQAILFASMHPYDILGMILIFITGIVFGFLAWKSNGLEASSAIHCMNNFSSAMMASLGIEFASSVVTPTAFAEDLFVLVITAFALYYIANKYNWFSKKTN